MSQHWRMELNNYAQKNRITFQWNDLKTGPQNAPTWTSRVFLNGIEVGRGSALNTGDAREIAAEHALRTVWSMRSPQ